jgi:tetratricopeptide (TPR) repeat protein
MQYKIVLVAFAICVSILSFGKTLGAEEAKDWFQEGNRLAREGRFDSAVEAYQKSLKLNPGATVVYYNLGLAHKKMKQYGQAVTALEKAVEMEPDYLEAHLALGNCYNLMEQWESAIAHLNLVVHQIPDDAEAHGNLGWALYNYKVDPPFKMLVVINLRKAVRLFEAQGFTQAAEATRGILDSALAKYKMEMDD